MRPVSKTPINGDLSPHRRFDWLEMPLEEVKVVRRKLGCSLNDVVLATVAGAVGEFFRQRQVDPAVIDFRVSAPVSIRRDAERGKLGNRVSSWIVPLPVAELDPVQRVRALSYTHLTLPTICSV